MKLLFAIILFVLAAPLLLLLAVALGPVILGILCAALFGVLVFALWSLAVALGLLGRQAGLRYTRRERALRD